MAKIQKKKKKKRFKSQTLASRALHIQGLPYIFAPSSKPLYLPPWTPASLLVPRNGRHLPTSRPLSTAFALCRRLVFPSSFSLECSARGRLLFETFLGLIHQPDGISSFSEPPWDFWLLSRIYILLWFIFHLLQKGEGEHTRKYNRLGFESSSIISKLWPWTNVIQLLQCFMGLWNGLQIMSTNL